MEIGGEVLDDINSLGDVTILAPSNEAWNASNIENIIGYEVKIYINLYSQGHINSH